MVFQMSLCSIPPSTQSRTMSSPTTATRAAQPASPTDWANTTSAAASTAARPRRFWSCAARWTSAFAGTCSTTSLHCGTMNPRSTATSCSAMTSACWIHPSATRKGGIICRSPAWCASAARRGIWTSRPCAKTRRRHSFPRRCSGGTTLPCARPAGAKTTFSKKENDDDKSGCRFCKRNSQTKQKKRFFTSYYCRSS